MFDPLQIPNVWRAQSLATRASLLPTGFAVLDEALGGGWPTPAFIEILIDTYGIGELQLLVPLLRSVVTNSPQPVVVAWLNPPYEPNAVALAQHGLGDSQHWLVRNVTAKDTLWSMEQALKSRACAAVLAWASGVSMPSLRRLKLAVQGAAQYAILFRPSVDSAQASPAHVRLQLVPHQGRLLTTVLKAPGRKRCELLIDIDSLRLQRSEVPA